MYMFLHISTLYDTVQPCKVLIQIKAYTPLHSPHATMNVEDYNYNSIYTLID